MVIFEHLLHIIFVMNSELLFEGKKYISSKRASQLSGYNQDYIGQLIRDSKIEARRVGRHWFVSLESLENQFEKIKGKSLPKSKKDVGGEKAQESNPLYLEGKKFISSLEASAFSGYSRDYIGQLVREEKLEGKLVGRLWFISLPSLEKHLAKQTPKSEETKPTLVSAVYPLEKIEKISKYEKEISPALPSFPQKEKVIHFEKEISYPAFVSKKNFSFGYRNGDASSAFHLKRLAISSIIAVVLIFGAHVVYYQINKEEIAARSNSVLASASVVSSSALDSFALDWYRFINGKFIGVNKFFASIFGSKQLAYETSSVQQKSVPQGVVVVPNDAQGEETVSRIKASFSDKVGIARNPDGVTGLITPEFKKVTGDEYLYVLVPVKERKQ